MSENRFVAEQVDVVNEDETEVWDIVFDTENTYAFMVRDTDTASGLCDLLNEQEQKIQRWKTLYEIKDKEVTARVDGLNKVCEYYLTEAQFKADTDPNKAVKEVINRILNTEVEKMSTSMTENKNCGTCKHLQIDGMFGMWCDLDKDWENVEYCSDWER